MICRFSTFTIGATLAICTCFGGLQAQNSLKATKTDSPDASPQFEAISIRLNNSGGIGVIANGIRGSQFRGENVTAAAVIFESYFTNHPEFWNFDRIQGAPAWLSRTRFTIVGKFADEDFKRISGLLMLEQNNQLASFLKRMLADRFKMSARIVPTPVDGYMLVSKKNGLIVTPATPDANIPELAHKLPGGGLILPILPGGKAELKFFHIPMSSFAAQLSLLTATPIVDGTGLTGEYDFALPKADQGPGGRSSNDDPYFRAHVFDVEAIGLELRPAKVPATTLVIDHIELPTEN